VPRSESPSLGGDALSPGAEALSLGGEALSLGGEAFSLGSEALSLGGEATSLGGEAPSLGGERPSEVCKLPNFQRKTSKSALNTVSACRATKYRSTVKPNPLFFHPFRFESPQAFPFIENDRLIFLSRPV
jgi:hypothetical protein